MSVAHRQVGNPRDERRWTTVVLHASVVGSVTQRTKAAKPSHGPAMPLGLLLTAPAQARCGVVW